MPRKPGGEPSGISTAAGQFASQAQAFSDIITKQIVPVPGQLGPWQGVGAPAFETTFAQLAAAIKAIPDYWQQFSKIQKTFATNMQKAQDLWQQGQQAASGIAPNLSAYNDMTYAPWSNNNSVGGTNLAASDQLHSNLTLEANDYTDANQIAHWRWLFWSWANNLTSYKEGDLGNWHSWGSVSSSDVAGCHEVATCLNNLLPDYNSAVSYFQQASDADNTASTTATKALTDLMTGAPFKALQGLSDPKTVPNYQANAYNPTPAELVAATTIATIAASTDQGEGFWGMASAGGVINYRQWFLLQAAYPEGETKALAENGGVLPKPAGWDQAAIPALTSGQRYAPADGESLEDFAASHNMDVPTLKQLNPQLAVVPQGWPGGADELHSGEELVVLG